MKIESKHNGKWWDSGTYSATVRCNKCKARGPTASCKVNEAGGFTASEQTLQQAADRWNKRVEDTSEI